MTEFVEGQMVEIRVLTPFQPSGVTSWKHVRFSHYDGGFPCVKLEDGKLLKVEPGNIR